MRRGSSGNLLSIHSFTPNNISNEKENKLLFFLWGETWTAAHSANTPGLPNFSPWGNERFVSQSKMKMLKHHLNSEPKTWMWLENVSSCASPAGELFYWTSEKTRLMVNQSVSTKTCIRTYINVNTVYISKVKPFVDLSRGCLMRLYWFQHFTTRRNFNWSQKHVKFSTYVFWLIYLHGSLKNKTAGEMNLFGHKLI